MSEHVILDAAAIARTLTRLSHEVVEKNKGTEELCLLGIRRRGEIVAERIRALIGKFYESLPPCGGIDIGMYRDDLVSGFLFRMRGSTSLIFRLTEKMLCCATMFCIPAGVSERRSKRSWILAGRRRSCCWYCATAAEKRCRCVRILWGKTFLLQGRNL